MGFLVDIPGRVLSREVELFGEPSPMALGPARIALAQGAAVVVGTIIGSGIFLVPAEMMQAVGSAKVVYLAWGVGGLLSFAGALTYAELGAMKPQAGGEYVYVRDAYGPLVEKLLTPSE